jgi:hypothetical protein
MPPPPIGYLIPDSAGEPAFNPDAPYPSREPNGNAYF